MCKWYTKHQLDVFILSLDIQHVFYIFSTFRMGLAMFSSAQQPYVASGYQTGQRHSKSLNLKRDYKTHTLIAVSKFT